MGAELVNGSVSDTDGEGEISPIRFSFTKQFEEQFPYYLSIGMTYDQYWNDDCMLVKYYRQAHELKNEQKNQELWLQGYYIYHALVDVSPLLQSMAKKGTKAHPYLEEPFTLTQKNIDEKKKRDELNQHKLKKTKMEIFAAAFNTKFTTKED